MRTTILLVALAVAASAWAQAPAPKKEPAKPEAQQPRAEKTVAVAKKSRRHEDARHCLERGSNIEIIKCAEEYL